MVDDAEKEANIWTANGKEEEMHHQQNKQDDSRKGVENTKNKWLSK